MKICMDCNAEMKVSGVFENQDGHIFVDYKCACEIPSIERVLTEHDIKEAILKSKMKTDIGRVINEDLLLKELELKQ